MRRIMYISFAIVSALSGATANAQTFAIESELLRIRQICTASPASCTAVVDDLLDKLATSVTDPDLRNAMTGALVATLAELGSQGPNPDVANAVLSAAQSFTGPDAPARVAAATRIADAARNGGGVDTAIVAQLSSPN